MSFRSANDKLLEELRIKNNLKGKIYQAFSEYIECLENSLKSEEDSFFRLSLKREIKELREEQQKYYVPSVMEMPLRNSNSLEVSGIEKKKVLKHRK